MGQMLRMATVGGARTTRHGESRGTLEVARAADMVLIDWRDIAWPYLDPEIRLLDAVIQRAKASAVRATICDGDLLNRDGRFKRVNRGAQGAA
jgi:5-methylthioadenosine/S-adenosylhomocysteine deaminase